VSWFKNLKKWQKGGLIGCAVGLLLAAIIILSPYGNPVGEWIDNFHVAIFFLAFLLSGIFQSFETGSGYVAEYIGLAATVIFYGGLGALFGRVQQMATPIWKWLLTALLVLLLLFFYASYFI